MAVTPIEAVLCHYFPGWEPPADRSDWNPCRCPSHDEDRPSCDVNFRIGVVKCHACGFKGNPVSIVKQREGVTYAEAVRRTEAILAEVGSQLSPEYSRKPGRRSFGGARTSGRGRDVPPWLRS